jgi:hypothetical protein
LLFAIVKKIIANTRKENRRRLAESQYVIMALIPCQESKKAKKNSKTKERKKKRKWRRRGNPHLQYQSREYFTRDD